MGSGEVKSDNTSKELKVLSDEILSVMGKQNDLIKDAGDIQKDIERYEQRIERLKKQQYTMFSKYKELDQKRTRLYERFNTELDQVNE